MPISRRTVLSPVLNERQVNMIAFSACIGVGLFLRSGQIICLAGPGLAVVSFVIAGTIMWAVCGCLGEMTALFPVQGPLFEFTSRFLDESVGYATGWMAWFSWVCMIASELLALSQMWKFRFNEQYLRDVGYPEKTLGWSSTEGASPAVWVFIFLIVIIVVNLMPVRIYGQIEYVVGVLKITFIVGLIVFNILVSAVQPVAHESRFWTWNKPYGFATQGFSTRGHHTVSGDFGRFLALWTSMRGIFFAMLGFETVAVTAMENKDLETDETIKLASRKIVLRLTTLYTLAVFAVGLNVPYDDYYLKDLTINDFPSGQNSIFILAAVRNHLTGWPHFFNGFFIFSAATSGINCLYNSSRILHALASIPEAWPRWAQGFRKRLERTTSYGVPIGTIAVSWLFGLLGFLGAKTSSALALGQVSTTATICILIVYANICAAYIPFFHSIRRASQDPNIENRSSYNRDEDHYPYRTRGQIFRAVYGLGFTTLIIVLTGWQSFVSPFSAQDFVASYIAIPTFFVLIALYHIKTDGINPLKWRRSASKQLARPPPMVVVPGRRRGHLYLPDEKTWFTEDNAKSFIDWLWIWVK